MAKKKLLQDSEGQIWPITTADCVYLSDGSKTVKKYIDDALSGKADNSHGTHLTLGTTSSTAYRGDRGNTAYNHSQAAHAPSNAQKNSDITKAEIEAKLTGTITTHSHNYKAKEPTSFGLNTDYVAVRTTGRTADQYYEFWDSVGWADIRAGAIYDNNNRVYSASNKPTPADIGAAKASHGTHLTIGTGASNAAAGNHTHNNATTSSAGFMSSTDKAKLNLIEITSSQFTYQGSSTTQSNYAFGLSNTFNSESECSGAFGSHNKLNGAEDSVAIGDWNTVTASSGIAIGNSCTSSGQYGIAMGTDATTASYAFSMGNATVADFGSNAMGHYNISYKGNNGGTSGAAFIIGNGSSTSSRSNACRITYAGAVIGKAAYQSSGADYAEYFEWLDGNPNSEDRVGYFVTMDEDKIKIAKEGDYLLGVVSAYPAVIGNNDMEWQGQFLTDEYGRPLKEIKTGFKAGKSVRDIETGIKIATEIEEYEYEYYIVNPEYDPDKKYVHREDRPEWDAIGMMGVLAVHDDGTCEVNGFCKCNNEGIATACERGCDSYRVIKRVNDHIVKIIFK